MSTIEFKDLNKSIGTELFTDTESFLEDLGDDAADVVGGSGGRFTTAYRPYQTTHYIPSEHPVPPHGVSATIIRNIPRHPRPIHPIRHPHPVLFAGNDI